MGKTGERSRRAEGQDRPQVNRGRQVKAKSPINVVRQANKNRELWDVRQVSARTQSDVARQVNGLNTPMW